MMINHSKLDCHVTFSIRFLGVPEQRFGTLTLLSDLKCLTKANAKTLALTRNSTDFLMWSYDVIDTVFCQYLARGAF